MSKSQSDALVFFGATGDLAYKKIFPSLQAMVKRGNLNVPVIGVAKAGWNLDQLRARAQDSLEKHGGVDRPASKSCAHCCVMSMAITTTPPPFDALRKALGFRGAAGALPGHSAGACSGQSWNNWGNRVVRKNARASSSKNPLGPTSSPHGI